ncbi:TIGR01458 family HAD-type hydrolase [Georgenia yuyongxinii]
MLRLSDINLDELAATMDEPRSYESSSWIDPNTGALEYCSVEDDAQDFEDRGLVMIETLETSESYEIMEDFVAQIRSRTARLRLTDAIQGRGAFHRFRDTLHEFPDELDRWYAYRDCALRRLAVDWLIRVELIDAAAGEAALAAMEREGLTRTVRAVLLDVDGVLTVSWRPLPGAVEAVAALRGAGVRLALVTSTTSRTRASTGAALREAGFAVDDEEIVTAPVAAAAYLAEHHRGARCLLLNSGDVAADLAGVDLVGPDAQEVDVVLVGGAGPEFDYDSLNRAFGHLRRGAALVAMHRSMYWRTDGGLQLDAGAFVAALEAAAGVEAEVVGKPSRTFFTAAAQRLGVPADETVMVGDDITADVLAAQDAGLVGVLVRTGKFLPGRWRRRTPRPRWCSTPSRTCRGG